MTTARKRRSAGSAVRGARHFVLIYRRALTAVCGRLTWSLAPSNHAERSWLKRLALSQARKSVRAARALRPVLLMLMPEIRACIAEAGGERPAVVTIIEESGLARAYRSGLRVVEGGCGP